MSPNLDRLATEDAVNINEVSEEGISATYHITVQQCAKTALFNTGANMSNISQKCLTPTKTKTAKIKYMYSDVCQWH